MVAPAGALELVVITPACADVTNKIAASPIQITAQFLLIVFLCTPEPAMNVSDGCRFVPEISANGDLFVAHELLHALAIDLGHVNRAVFAEGDAVRHEEIAGLGAALPPGFDFLSYGGEVEDAVRTAVGDEDFVRLGKEQPERGEAAEL